MFKKKKYYLGRYEKKEDAIAVRKIAEKEIFGNFLEWHQNNKNAQNNRMENGVIMSQEMFWIFSTINFAVVMIMSIINMIISVLTATKMRYLNKKIGVDLSMHKELMNSICNFISSIEDNKVNYYIGGKKYEEFYPIIKGNYSEFKDRYIKLNLYMQYSYTDSRDLRIALDKIYNKYCNAFEILLSSLSDSDIINGFKRKEEIWNENSELSKMLESKFINSLEGRIVYENILKDKIIDDDFFDKLEIFIKNESNYIKSSNVF